MQIFSSLSNPLPTVNLITFEVFYRDFWIFLSRNTRYYPLKKFFLLCIAKQKCMLVYMWIAQWWAFKSRLLFRTWNYVWEIFLAFKVTVLVCDSGHQAWRVQIFVDDLKPYSSKIHPYFIGISNAFKCASHYFSR